jgi:hypothetical protein
MDLTDKHATISSSFNRLMSNTTWCSYSAKKKRSRLPGRFYKGKTSRYVSMQSVSRLLYDHATLILLSWDQKYIMRFQVLLLKTVAFCTIMGFTDLLNGLGE